MRVRHYSLLSRIRRFQTQIAWFQALAKIRARVAVAPSQGGSGAGAALQTCPTCPLTRIDPALFRVLLLRRLRLPLPLSARFCRCGRPLDSRGHHRAACARAGVLGRRGFAVESAAARICREGGARVTTNVMVRDMDLAAPNPGDARRLEIVADGLPLFGGAQLADLHFALWRINTTRDGRHGWCGVSGCQEEERTHLSWVGRPPSRARLVVLAGEVGGRWCPETRAFLSQLARAKARHEPRILRQRVQQAWRSRWQAHAQPRKHSRGRCWNWGQRWVLTVTHSVTRCVARLSGSSGVGLSVLSFLLTKFSSELCVTFACQKKKMKTKSWT